MIIAAFLLRLLLIYYGTIHDSIMEVAYTDIDYSVFTEAAEHIYNGKSPYQKDTYKYTPVLAQMLLPNVSVHILFGKILFSIFDILVAFILHRICVKSMLLDCKKSAKWISFFWLFNPFTITISSRGNAEGVQIFLVTFSILLVLEKRFFLAGLIYGLSVHFKLYPIIYAWSILLYISQPLVFLQEKTWYKKIRGMICCVFKEDLLHFSVSACFSFFGIGFMMYKLYVNVCY